MSSPTSDQLFAPFAINMLLVDSASVDIDISHVSVDNQPLEFVPSIGFPVSGEYYDCAETDDGKAYRVSIALPVSVALKLDMDDEDPAVQISARGFASYTFPKPREMPEEREQTFRHYMKTNAVSILYAHVRGVFLDLAAKTPIRSFVLPPVYPDQLLEALDAELETAKQDEAEAETAQGTDQQ